MNFEKSKGAISIFLVIILVPMMTVSSIFVDVSKVNLAKAVADSASDLALNTALSCYDTDLKDLYGLLATAQDTSELYNSLESYYRTSIVSAGVSTEDADSYVEQIMAQLGMVAESDDTADILGMQLLDFGVEKRDDLTLVNPTILKTQIVEFMKYRSPINTGLSFLEALQSFKTLDKQTELVDKRTEYYSEEQSVMEETYNAWKNIKYYADSDFVRNYKYFEDMKAAFDNYQNVYEYYARRITKALYDIDGYTEFKGKIYSIQNYTVELDNGQSYTGLVFYTNKDQTSFRDTPADLDLYSEDAPADANDFKAALVDLYNAREAFLDSYDALFGFGAEKISSTEYSLKEESTYELQYLVQVQRNGLYDNWIAAVCDYYDAYAVLVHCFENLGDIDITSLKAKMCGSSTEKSYGDHYLDLRGAFENSVLFINNWISEINSRLGRFAEETKVILGEDPASAEQTIRALYTQVSGYRDEIQNAHNYLSVAKPHLQSVYEMVKPGGTLDQRKGEWSAAASDKAIKDTTMAKQDNAEISSLSTYLKPEYVDALIKRVDEILPNLESMLRQIDSYQIYETPICEIDSLNTFRWVLGDALGESTLKNAPLVETELDAKVEEWCTGKFTIGENLSTEWDKNGLSDMSQLNFYGYMYQHFGDSVEPAAEQAQESEKEKAEGLYDQMKSKTEEEAQAQTEKGKSTATYNDIKTRSDYDSLPSQTAGSSGSTASASVNTKVDDEGGNAVKSTSSGLSGMLKNLGDALVDLGKELRDNIYVSDYMLSMFSYDTIEKELEKKAQEAGKSADDAEKPMTLTKVELNSDNCYAYQREVEYILYGGENSSNLTKSYGSIYGIRLGFNLIYAFSASEIRETALAIATPISAATMGIIPVPLIQAALIVGIACVESGFDLNNLRQGEKVPLFKNEETWHASVSGLLNEVKGEAVTILSKAADKAIDKGVSVLSDLLDKTDEELSAYIAEKGDSVVNGIMEEYDSLITRHADMAIQKLTTLANNALEQCMMEPATNAAQYVKDGLQNWLAEEAVGTDTSTDIAYIAKEAAVNAIINGGFIDQVLEIVASEKGKASAAIDSIGDELNNKLTAVRTEIERTLERGCEKIQSYKSEIKQNIMTSMGEGAESLKATLNSSISKTFGASASGQSTENTGMSSLLSFRYSDYLRFFLVIGLYTNQPALLYRTADVIQVNMDKRKGGYQLSNSAVYVKLHAEILVKPTLLALPLFSGVENNPVNNEAWYTISVDDIRGY